MVDYGFKPGEGYENDPEVQAWARESNMWAFVYCVYDDNERHMMRSFENNQMFDSSSTEIHAETVDFVKSLGVDMMTQIAEESGVKELLPYIEEARQKLERENLSPPVQPEVDAGPWTDTVQTSESSEEKPSVSERPLPFVESAVDDDPDYLPFD